MDRESVRLAKREFAKGHRVLVADDNPDVLWILGDLLKRNLGVEVILAENGSVAVEKAKQDHPDVILMDLMMPVMDGVEATQVLKGDAFTKDIPVVAFTALTSAFSRDTVMKSGFHAYLEKPFDYDDLLDMVVKMVAV